MHRDIENEITVLDEEGRIKPIDFGSAAYIKNGRFDVFMGTTSKIFCVDMFFPQIQVALTRPYILGYSLRDPAG